MTVEFTGTVVRGDELGRNFGFPTANIFAENSLKPGIYSGIVEFENVKYPSAIIIHPQKSGKIIEAHLMDFSQDLYGKTILIQVKDFLRDWLEFPDINTAVKQIEQDLINIKDLDLLHVE